MRIKFVECLNELIRRKGLRVNHSFQNRQPVALINHPRLVAIDRDHKPAGNQKLDQLRKLLISIRFHET
jgi:hypothetical protein